MGRKKNDSKKKEVHFENTAIQLVVNSTMKPFGECEGCVDEDRKEGEVKVGDDGKKVEVEDESHPTESQHPTIHPTTEHPNTPPLSLLDKVTLGFFVLLNSLGHALKKLARSFLGLFSKDEDE